MKYQYKPDVSVRFCPRVSSRLWNTVNRLCIRHDMSELTVVRFSFEAAVLTAPKRLKRVRSRYPGPLNAMISIYTSRRIGKKVAGIWLNNPNVLKADVLRALLESMLSTADQRGMAYVIKLRELALAKLRS